MSLLRILALASVPFRLTTVQMPNFSLIETKRITVLERIWFPFGIILVNKFRLEIPEEDDHSKFSEPVSEQNFN